MPLLHRTEGSATSPEPLCQYRHPRTGYANPAEHAQRRPGLCLDKHLEDPTAISRSSPPAPRFEGSRVYLSTTPSLDPLTGTTSTRIMT
jgi:hypothetical protein